MGCGLHIADDQNLISMKRLRVKVRLQIWEVSWSRWACSRRRFTFQSVDNGGMLASSG